MKQHLNLWSKGSMLYVSLFLFLFAHAQSMQLKGRIVDSTTKNPVVAATIQDRTNKKTTVTDGEGNFSISVSNGDQLLISFIGFQSKVFTVAGEDFLNIELSNANNQLNDVVVTALGVKKEVKRLGYSIQ